MGRNFLVFFFRVQTHCALGTFLHPMAAPLDDAARRAFVASHMDSDLQFILAESGVSVVGQYHISQAYTTLRRFHALADDRAGVRQVCRDDLNIPQDSAQSRAEAASVVAAWETAKEYIAKEVELRAEAKVLGHPRILQVHERQAMIRAVEAVHGVLNEAEAPSQDYLSVKADETESNEPVAAQLDEILSKRDSTNAQIQSSVDSAGHIRVTRTKNKAKMPSTTEEYRRIMKVEMFSWLCMAARYRSKHWLHGLTSEPFLRFVDFILGDRVYGVQVPSGSGETQRVKPDWTIVLAFEHKLRKEAMKLVVNQGHTLANALGAVIRDPDLKEAYFTTPIALKAAATPELPPNKWQRSNNKGSSADLKGKSKGQVGKGRGKNSHAKGKPIQDSRLAGLSLAWRTPDNRDLCFAWNSGHCDGKCNRVHQCRVKGCYADHQAIHHRDKVAA